MYSLTVCDHIMIAHSFHGEEFGPAQKLHGATFAVEAEFRAPKLDHLQLLVDIGLAKTELRRVLDTAGLQQPGRQSGVRGHQHDDGTHGVPHPWLARRGLPRRAAGRRRPGGDGSLKILLRESPNAWAAYEGALA